MRSAVQVSKRLKRYRLRHFFLSLSRSSDESGKWRYLPVDYLLRRQNEVEGFRCDNENWLRTRSCNFKNNGIVSFIVFIQTYFIIEFDNHEIVLT